MADEYDARAGHLSLPLRVSTSEISVIGDASEIPASSRILSINGVTTAELLRTLEASISRDGLNTTYPRFVLNHSFAEQYARALGQSAYFEIIYEDPQDNDRRISIPGAPLDVARQVEISPVALEMGPRHRYAILTIRAFVDEPSVSFSDLVEREFTKLKDSAIEKLIIDIRGNTGGYPPHAALLLSYLIPHPFTYFAGEAAPGDEFEVLFKPLPPEPKPFSGEVILLIDGANISTAGHFASLFRSYHVGILVGEETGGSSCTNSNGRTVTLKNSGLEVNIPQRVFCTAADGLPAERGIRPDIRIEPTVDDGVDDPVLETALRALDV